MHSITYGAMDEDTYGAMDEELAFVPPIARQRLSPLPGAI
jgi:hypothetical protein